MFLDRLGDEFIKHFDKLILGTKSPQRFEIFNQMGIINELTQQRFFIIPSKFKEDLDISFDDMDIITSLIPSEMDETTAKQLLKYHKELRSKYLSTNNEVPFWGIKRVKFENILISDTCT